MNITNVKRWQWIGIGFVVGSLLSLAQISALDGERGGAMRTISGTKFIEKIHARAHNDLPALRRVVVHPSREVDSAIGCHRINYVTGEMLNRGGADYVPFAMHAKIPFREAGTLSAAHPNFSVRQYLADLSKAGVELDYRYAWWETPKMISALWGGGSVLLIGGVWPIVLNLLVGAGLEVQRSTDVEYDLSRFASGTAEVKPSPPVPSWELTADELAGRTPAPPNPPPPPAQASPVRALGGDAGAAAVQEANPTPHEYRGEFYPVEKPPKAPADPQR